MTAINIKAFRGAVPRIGSRLLQPNQAAIADNCKLTSGNLEPLKGLQLTHTSQLADIQTAYFWRAIINSRVEDNWLVWGSDVDIVKSLIPNDPEQRIYFSSDAFEPRMTTFARAINSLPYPTAWYALGVVAPSTAATVAVTQQPVGGVTVTDGGAGYETAPTVTFSSGGAAAAAIISGELLSITLTNGGSSYETAPAVIIKGSGGVGATAKAIIDAAAGVVTAVEIVTKGVGFTQAPEITFTGGGGSGAAATAKIYAQVVRVVINDPGSYTTLPTVTFSGGNAATQASGDVFFEQPITRAYAYTYVTALGEESPPSPPSVVTEGSAAGTWALSGIQAAPPNTGTVSAAASIGNEQVRVTLNTTFGLSQFDTITFSAVEGMTSLNGTFRIQALGPTANTLVVNLNTAQTYTTGGSWTKAAPHNTTGMTKRIYRTTGVGGDFLFVAEIAVATTTYTDAVAAEDLGEILPTADSLLPPKNLVALTSLPNGCLVGISGNEVCFSDPYLPYSWPLRNRYTFSGVGVDLVSAGNSVIVLTDSFPVLFTGSDPEAMSPSVMQTYAPCATKRGVVDVGGGCMFPSYDGLWIAAPGRVEKLTAKLYREEEWRTLNPESFVAGFADGQYYAGYTVGGSKFIFVYDTAENDSVIRVEQDASYLLRNDTDGELYLALGNKVYQVDGNDNQRYASDWVSSEMQLPMPMNFSVAQVHGAFNQIRQPDTSILLANESIFGDVDLVGGAVNADSILAVEVNGSNLALYEANAVDRAQFTLYKDGQPTYTVGLTSSEPFRLPADCACEVYQVGINTTIPIYNVTIADSVAELAQAST
jgi:hypothetical protein